MSLTIAGHGVELEAVLREPEEQRFRGAVVLCHPHPLYGGTMDNKVVFRSAKAALSAGWAALRFNFRGVGRSTGTYDHGEGEKEDVRAAIDFIAGRYPELPVALLGFSFGARVGLEVGMNDARILALVGLGLPLRMHDFDYLAGNAKPTLILAGVLDEYCPPDKLQALAARLPPTTTVRTIDGADHFFTNDLDTVHSYVSRFFLQLKPARSGA
jgi:alpha/beta superfamily hydrolase